MKRESILKLLTVVLMVALIVGIAKSSLAVAAITSIENSTVNETNNTLNNVSTNEPENNVTANNTIPVNNNVAVNETIPDTGAKSSVGIIVLIVVASVSALYTYTKVKKYNI